MSEGHDEYSHPIPDAGRVLKLPETKPHPNLLTENHSKTHASGVYFRENFAEPSTKWLNPRGLL